jgi:prophage regulatory protein
MAKTNKLMTTTAPAACEPPVRVPAQRKLQRVVRKKDLPQFVGLQRTALDDLIARGEFPRPIRVGARAIAWLADDLVAWQQARIAASTNNK